MNKKHKVYIYKKLWKYTPFVAGTMREIIKGEWTPHGVEVNIKYR